MLKIDVEHMNSVRRKIGGKWKPMLILILVNKGFRFNKIRQLLPGISANMLTSCLKEMEESALVYKDETGYSLTDKGKKISGMLSEIIKIASSLP